MAESCVITKTILPGQKVRRLGDRQDRRDRPADLVHLRLRDRPSDRSRGARGRLVPRLWVQRNAAPSSPPRIVAARLRR